MHMHLPTSPLPSPSSLRSITHFHHRTSYFPSPKLTKTPTPTPSPIQYHHSDPFFHPGSCSNIPNTIQTKSSINITHTTLVGCLKQSSNISKPVFTRSTSNNFINAGLGISSQSNKLGMVVEDDDFPLKEASESSKITYQNPSRPPIQRRRSSLSFVQTITEVNTPKSAVSFYAKPDLKTHNSETKSTIQKPNEPKVSRRKPSFRIDLPPSIFELQTSFDEEDNSKTLSYNGESSTTQTKGQKERFIILRSAVDRTPYAWPNAGLCYSLDKRVGTPWECSSYESEMDMGDTEGDEGIDSGLEVENDISGLFI